MTVEQDLVPKIEIEVEESEPKSEDDWKKVFWSDEDAKLVGEFLRGIVPERVELTSEVLGRLALNTDLMEEKEARNRQKKELRRVAEEKLAGKESKEVGVRPEEKYGEIESGDEYTTVNKLMGRTILRVAVGSLMKNGIVSPEAATFITRGAVRKGKGGYGYDDWMGEESETKVHPEMVIRAPAYDLGENEKSFGNTRLRGSLAHEIDHAVRALANKSLWGDVDSGKLGVLRPVNRLFVGGFRVGSNKQGSEGIGNLFSEVVKLRTQGKETKIRDLVEPIAGKLSVNLGKDKVEPRYRIALTALFDHLVQLDRLGYGDIEAADLLALGMYGYVSLEKLPDLIRGGVVTKNKKEKMMAVAKDILGWFTSPSEEGYHLA